MLAGVPCTAVHAQAPLPPPAAVSLAAGDAADAADAALDLADALPAEAAAARRTWQGRIELALQHRQLAPTAAQPGHDGPAGEAAAELSLDRPLAQGVTLRAALRLQHVAHWRQPGDSVSRGRLKEASLAWWPTAQHGVEFGRIVERSGAALGSNPTDFFAAGAVASDAAPDPESRRAQRLGSVMARAQQLWPGAAVSAMWSPRLASAQAPGAAATGGDLQRSNGVGRLLLVASHRMAETLQPRWLLYREEGGAPQLGLDLSRPFGDAVVGYLEWAGGRMPSLSDLAAGRRQGAAFSARSVVGARWTLPIDLTLTVELQHDGSALDGDDLRRLATAAPAAWGGLMQSALAAQRSPTREGRFVHLAWRDAFWRRLDLSGFLQHDPEDGGRQLWLEARHRFDGADLALQWQHQHGPAWSRFGAASERRRLQLRLTYYL